MNIAIIPARGGSKRLPRKNILPFMGKPMLIWTCEAARDSGLFDSIVVSTEDNEIAEITKKYGFHVFMRAQNLATDRATCAEVCLEVLERFAQEGKVFQNLCCLYATAPLRSASDMQATMCLLDDGVTLSAFAATHYDYPPYQALSMDTDGFIHSCFPLIARMKSQDLPTPLIDNGSTYAIKVTDFLKVKDFYTSKMRAYIMPKIKSVDIDTQEDYNVALLYVGNGKG